VIDFLYELLGGQHQELPRRARFADPRLDATGAVFLTPDDPTHHGWLGRGELPGPVRAQAPVGDDAQTVAEEMRALAQTPPTRR
jgi:hypothetical protein